MDSGKEILYLFGAQDLPLSADPTQVGCAWPITVLFLALACSPHGHFYQVSVYSKPLS